MFISKEQIATLKAVEKRCYFNDKRLTRQFFERVLRSADAQSLQEITIFRYEAALRVANAQLFRAGQDVFLNMIHKAGA